MFVCSNLRIEGNRAIYGIKSEKHDFESRTSKVVHQIRNTYRRACYLIKKFIGASYHIEFICSNMRIENNGAIYKINTEKHDCESRTGKLVRHIRKTHDNRN